MSIVELTITSMLGKFDLPGDPAEAARAVGLSELPFSSAHARDLVAFPELARHDPFDRMLLAQAQREKLQFLTADPRLLELGLRWAVDAAV